MSALEQIALAWQCLGHAFRQLVRPALWGPWLLLGVLQAGAVAALGWFAHPSVSWAMVPVVAGTAGEPALHYPGIFRVLPALYARADLVLGATIGAVAAGVSTAMFASRFESGAARPAAAWRAGAGRAVSLMLVNLPVTLIAFALSWAAETWLGEGSGAPRRIVWIATLGLTLLVQAWFLYATAFVVLERRDPLVALARLPLAARRGMVAALFLTVVTLVPLLPIQRMTDASATIVSRGVPELVASLVLLQVAIGLVGSFLLTGGATLVFQSAIMDRREDGW